jgi:fluoride exporter
VEDEHGRSHPGVLPAAPPNVNTAKDPVAQQSASSQDADLDSGSDESVRAARHAAPVRLEARLLSWLRRRGRIYAVIAAGGFVGGNARYALGLAWPDRPGAFPWTTFGINVSGSFILALLLILILEGWNAPTWVRPLVGTGFLGAFTTFSAVTFALDRFAAANQWALFWAYTGFSILAGLAAASFGILLGRAWVAARARHSVKDRSGERSDADRGHASEDETLRPPESAEGVGQ